MIINHGPSLLMFLVLSLLRPDCQLTGGGGAHGQQAGAGAVKLNRDKFAKGVPIHLPYLVVIFNFVTIRLNNLLMVVIIEGMWVTFDPLKQKGPPNV